MAEYIEREYAVDAVLDVYYDTPDINLSGEKFEDAILKIPAADVAPVRHGRWIKYQIPPIICCSNCDWATDVEEKNFQYCPNCGAKMDGERKENENGNEH